MLVVTNIHVLEVIRMKHTKWKYKEVNIWKVFLKLSITFSKKCLRKKYKFFSVTNDYFKMQQTKTVTFYKILF